MDEACFSKATGRPSMAPTSGNGLSPHGGKNRGKTDKSATLHDVTSPARQNRSKSTKKTTQNDASTSAASPDVILIGDDNGGDDKRGAQQYHKEQQRTTGERSKLMEMEQKTNIGTIHEYGNAETSTRYALFVPLPTAFHCEICAPIPKVYVDHNGLARHLKKVHLKSLEFVCRSCGTKFDTLKGCRVHQDRDEACRVH